MIFSENHIPTDQQSWRNESHSIPPQHQQLDPHSHQPHAHYDHSPSNEIHAEPLNPQLNNDQLSDNHHGPTTQPTSTPSAHAEVNHQLATNIPEDNQLDSSPSPSTPPSTPPAHSIQTEPDHSWLATPSAIKNMWDRARIITTADSPKNKQLFHQWLYELYQACPYDTAALNQITKISPAYLAAIFAGELEQIPHESLARGFIQCLAQLLADDPDPIMLAYRACYPRQFSQPALISSHSKGSGSEFYRKPLATIISLQQHAKLGLKYLQSALVKQRWLMLAMLLITLIIIISYVIYAWTHQYAPQPFQPQPLSSLQTATLWMDSAQRHQPHNRLVVPPLMSTRSIPQSRQKLNPVLVPHPRLSNYQSIQLLLKTQAQSRPATTKSPSPPQPTSSFTQVTPLVDPSTLEPRDNEPAKVQLTTTTVPSSVVPSAPPPSWFSSSSFVRTATTWYNESHSSPRTLTTNYTLALSSGGDQLSSPDQLFSPPPPALLLTTNYSAQSSQDRHRLRLTHNLFMHSSPQSLLQVSLHSPTITPRLYPIFIRQ